MKDGKKSTLLQMGTAAFFTGLVTYLAQRIYKENQTLDVTHYTISSKSLPSSFHNYKIVQITDLHHYRFGNHQEGLIDAIKKEKPDIICITGDLLEPRDSNQNSLDLLEGIQHIAPIYYVLGNHEARMKNQDLWIKRVEDFGVHVLRNQSITLRKNNESIELLGVSDPLCHHKYNAKKDLSYMNTLLQSFNTQDHTSYTILLSHRPELFEVYVESGMDLVLCGHAHGGQFRLPFIGAVYAPYQGLFPKYTNGVTVKDNTVQINNRGLGCSHIPFRINNPPELGVIILKSED